MSAEKSFAEIVRPMVQKYRSNSLSGMSLVVSSDYARKVADTLEIVAERADTWRDLCEQSRTLDKRLPAVAIWIFAAGFGFGLVVAAVLEMV